MCLIVNRVIIYLLIIMFFSKEFVTEVVKQLTRKSTGGSTRTEDSGFAENRESGESFQSDNINRES